MSGERILSVDQLTMRFGGIVAVQDLSFAADRRKITALIGPNGAGKTTVFNCITGFYKPTGGTIRLTHDDGKEIALEGSTISASPNRPRSHAPSRTSACFRG